MCQQAGVVTPQSPTRQSSGTPSSRKTAVTRALVTAASVSHEADKFDAPRALVQLGGEYLINHVLVSLHSAEVRNVVIVIGQEGDEIKDVVNAVKEHLFPETVIEFLNLGEGWVGGHALSILAAKSYFSSDEDSFLICPVDHIYDDDLIHLMASEDKSLPKGGGARLLIEDDLAGMVGLPKATVHIATRPLHTVDRIYQIGNDLQAYSAIDAGLIRACPDVFAQLEQCERVLPYFTMVDVLKAYCMQGKLLMQKTGGMTWFSVETDTAAVYTEKELKSNGKKLQLPDGRTMNLVGLPRQVQATPSGGNWSEFSVAKWKDTVYCASSYFTDLFNDTTRFVSEYARALGGKEKVTIVEVGCGTGEALVPLVNHAKWVVGTDINPKFIEFCRGNVPISKRGQVKHLVGDVTDLCKQLHEELPEAMADTKKVVMCVGNTIGIIPEPVRSAAYEQMAELAGPTGVVVIVYWNGNKFGDAVQHFYNKNPQLCGEFDGSAIDLSTCTLRTPAGYTTHWTTPEEAKSLIAAKGFKLVACEESGRGVLVAYRQAPACSTDA